MDVHNLAWVLTMSEKCEERCPFCAPHVEQYGEGYHRVYLARMGKYEGCPRCGGCGAYLVNGEWIKECHTCGKHVDRLHGLFVPHNCLECQEKVRAEQRKSGKVCLRCRMVYADCCC